MEEIFISYKSERREAADYLAEVLRLHGYTVWFDYALIAGENFRFQINGKLRAAKAVIVLWCTMSVTSEWVDKEASLAADGKKLLPAMIEDCDVNVAYYTDQRLDLRTWDGSPRSGTLDPLLREVARLVGRPPQPDWEGLSRCEATWKRYGRQTLAQFALGQPIERTAEVAAPAARGRPMPVETIRFAPQSPRGPVVPAVPWGWVGASVAATLAVGYVAAYQLGVPVWVPWSPSPPPPVLQPTTAQTEAAARQSVLKEQEAKRVAAEQREKVAAEQRDPIAALAPGSRQAARDRLVNGQPCAFCPEMVVAPAGQFTMGSPASEPERESWQKGTESPQTRVSIARPFAVGKFAVTFDEWDACVADGGCNGHKPGDEGWGRGKRPVINVNWDDAKAYATWLSRKTGKSYRLLSEAEREYVTRAGTTTPFWWGTSITPQQANYDGSATPYKGGGSKGEYRQRTLPVDSFEANPWGLYHVHGNVWEWTEDCWNDSNQGNPATGSVRTSGECSRRVVRGGSWIFIPGWLRAALRLRGTTGDRSSGLSFRLGRTF